MCNPPFFESCETDKRFSVDKRSGALLNECSVDSEEAERAPPRSATLARRGELEFEGGEVAFIGRLIDDSVLLQTQVSSFSEAFFLFGDLFFDEKLMILSNCCAEPRDLPFGLAFPREIQ
ncbi:unnamed protein product [Cylicostephanus goldi]|uniref:Uncharacterized protein n=1 Tax=Cylicostephanus goldi TaxID=71465 RepID=A0A3P6UPT2_CYLGO|nr:unnamed protein product [Cylicostephanus goldi]